MKPIPSGMRSASASDCHSILNLKSQVPKNRSLTTRLAIVLTSLVVIPLSMNYLRLASAGAPNPQEAGKKGSKKSEATPVMANPAEVVMNPRGESLVYDNAFTVVPPVGPQMWAASLSADGKTLATAHGNQTSKGEVRMWDRQSGKVKASLLYDKGVRSVVFSPNGKVLASGCLDGGVRFHDPVTFAAFAVGDEKSGGHKRDGVNLIRFVNRGKYLASAGFDGSIRLWDVEAIIAARKASDTVRIAPVAVFEGHNGAVISVDGTEDGKTLLSSGMDSTNRLWDVPALPKMGEKPALISKERAELGGHGSPVEAVAISPDGEHVATGAQRGMLLLRDKAGTTIEIRSQFNGGVTCATFSRDGKYLAVGSGLAVDARNKGIRVFDVAGKQEIAVRSDFSDGVKGLEFTPDGKTLIVALANQTIHLWSWAEGMDAQTLTSSSNAFTPQPILAAAVSPDGSLIAFSGETQSVFVFKLGEEKLIELSGHEDVIASLAFSPDGKTLASGSYDKSIKLWNTETWKERRSLTGHTGWVFGIAFSPDGQTLVSGSYDKSLRLWNVERGQAKATWKEHSGGVRSVAFSPDGKKLISGGSDRIPRVWDVAEGKVLLALKGHKNAVRSVAFAPDGKTVASGSEDRTVKIWDAESGKESKTYSDFSDMVTSVHYSPRGQTLAAATFQGTIEMLDPISGRIRQTLRGHQDSVSSVLFAQDGRLISASMDRTIRQWPVTKTAISAPAQVVAGKKSIVIAAAITPGGAKAVLGYVDGTISICDLKNGTQAPYPGGPAGGITQLAVTNDMRIASVGKDGMVLVGTSTGQETWSAKGSFATFTPNGKQLAIVEGKDIVLYDAATGKRATRFGAGHEGNVDRCAFSPDGTLMVSAGQDTKVRLWEVATGIKRQETPAIGNQAAITHLAFSSDGTRIAFSAHGPNQPPPDDMTGMFRIVREVQVFTIPKDMGTFANPIVIPTQPALQPITGLYWTGNGTALALTGSDGTVRILELFANGAAERQQYQAHESAVLASAISIEARTLLTAGEDMAVRRWHIAGVPPASSQARLTSPGLTRVWEFLPSPDSKYFVAAGEGDKTFRVYGSLPTPLTVESDNGPAVLAMAFSPDNRFLVTGHAKGLLVVREAATGKKLRTLPGLSKQISSIAFAEKGAALVVAGGNQANTKEPGEAVIFDFPEGKIRHQLDAPAFQTMVAVHPNGKTVAISSVDGQVRLWDTATATYQRAFKNNGPSIKVVAFDSTGKRLAAGGYDHLIKIWEVSSGKDLHSISIGQLVPTKVLFSPDNKEIVVSAWHGGGQKSLKPAITAYSLEDPAAAPREFSASTASAMGLGFLPDGKTLLACGGESTGGGSIRVFDFATTRLLGHLTGHRHWGQTLAVSPDGKIVASTSWAAAETGELRLWDARGFNPIAEIKVPGENHYISSGAIGLDGKLLILGGWGQTLTAWDMTKPSKPLLLKGLKGHTAGLRSVAFDDAGKRFVSTDDAGTVIVWDAATLDVIVSFKAAEIAIYRAKFTPDGTQLVTVSGNWQSQAKGEMRVWDPKTGQEVGRFPDQPREVWDIAFLNGGKLMAALPAFGGGRDDAHLKIWDFEKKVVVRSLLPPASFSNGRSLGVSPDGKLLAVGSSTGPVKVFETNSWQEVLNVASLGNTTFRVNFTSDGNSLLVASGEGAAIAVRMPSPSPPTPSPQGRGGVNLRPGE